MSIRVVTLGLDEATLSGGARVASAAGGLPQRVTTADLVRVGSFQSAAGEFGNMDYCQIRPLSDGGIVVCTYSGGYLGRYGIDGSRVWRIAAAASSRVLSIDVDEAEGELYAANFNTGNVDVYALADGSLLRSWAAVATAGAIVTPAADSVWVGKLTFGTSDLLTEYDRDGNATGRTLNITGGAAASIHGLDSDGTWVYVGSSIASARGLSRVRISDSTVETYGTLATDRWREGDYWPSTVRDVAVGGGLVYTWIGAGAALEVFNADTGAHVARALRGGERAGEVEGRGSGHRHGLAISDDDDYLWIRDDQYSIQRIDRRTARAQWSRTFNAAATLKYLLVPGELGRERDADYDDRRTRLYYSTNGTDFTEFNPGAPLSVAITAGTTLTVRADMSTWAKPTGTPPWIGGDAGEGIAIVYDDGDTTGVGVTVSTPATVNVTVSNPTIRVTVGG